MKSSLSDRVKRIPVGDVLRRYGYPPGRGGFLSCPFHEDRTPSFKVYEDTNTWYCFSCRRHGTAVDFVMDLFALPFREAVNKLAGDFGVRDPGRETAEVRREVRKREEQKAEERATEQKWNFFCDALWDRYDTLYSVVERGGRLLTGAEYAEMEWLGYFWETYPLGARIPADRKKAVLDREWSGHLPLLEAYARKVSDPARRVREKSPAAPARADAALPDAEDLAVPAFIRSRLQEDPEKERAAGRCR